MSTTTRRARNPKYTAVRNLGELTKFLKKNEVFGADDVFTYFNTETEFAEDFELFRLIGGLIRSASAKGLIESTGDYRRSRRNSGNIGLVWKSKIYENE